MKVVIGSCVLYFDSMRSYHCNKVHSISFDCYATDNKLGQRNRQMVRLLHVPPRGINEFVSQTSSIVFKSSIWTCFPWSQWCITCFKVNENCESNHKGYPLPTQIIISLDTFRPGLSSCMHIFRSLFYNCVKFHSFRFIR